jgi:hypothetical protein
MTMNIHDPATAPDDDQVRLEVNLPRRVFNGLRTLGEKYNLVQKLRALIGNPRASQQLMGQSPDMVLNYGTPVFAVGNIHGVG